MICKSCGTKLSEGETICPKCGVNDTPNPPVQGKIMFCASCGQKLAEHSLAFCPACGTKTGAAGSVQPSRHEPTRPVMEYPPNKSGSTNNETLVQYIMPSILGWGGIFLVLFAVSRFGYEEVWGMRVPISETWRNIHTLINHLRNLLIISCVSAVGWDVFKYYRAADKEKESHYSPPRGHVRTEDKLCNSCDKKYDGEMKSCPYCGHRPSDNQPRVTVSDYWSCS